MKILYLHPNAWTGEYTILRELIRQGNEVCVLEEKRGLGTTRLHSPFFREPGDAISTFWFDPGKGAEKVLTWPVDRWFKRHFEGRNLAHRMWMIERAVACFQPDAVISSEGFSYGIPAALLKRLGLLRAPLMNSYIGGDILDCPEADTGKRRIGATTWLIQQGAKYPEVLRPVSPLVRDVLLKEGADAGRLKVIPSHLVAPLSHLLPFSRKRSELRQEIARRHGFDPAKPLIVTLGGNLKGKGLQVLVEAYPRILQSIPSITWLLCGPSNRWYERELLPSISSLFPRIICVGALRGDEVFTHLAAADIHVNPSLCESLNMVTVEAAAVGTPTIGSDAAGIAHWISRYGSGQVVRSAQADEFADAIIRAFSITGQLKQWGRVCQAMAAEFALEKIAQELVGCFSFLSQIRK